jgi:predicted transcriptional regulator
VYDDNLSSSGTTILKVVEKTNLKQDIVESIFKKLNTEGYIEIERDVNFINSSGEHSTTDIYKLTFNGFLLIQNNGYASKIERELSASKRDNIIAIAVAVGTGFAGILGLIECIKVIFRFLGWCCSCG